MAFRIQADESLPEGIRRIAAEQLRGALKGLEGRGTSEPEAVVHDVRKRLKRLRALIRLTRGGLGRKRADRENVRYREIARPLSGSRDARVLVEAFDDLVQRAGPPEHLESAVAIRTALVRRQREIEARVIQEGHALESAAADLRRARRAVRRWRIEGRGWRVLRKGVKRIYTAGHRDFLATRDDPEDEVFHDWRKRVKDLWHMLELLGPIRPRSLRALADQAHRLADALGDDHDLAVLREVLLDSAEEIADRAVVEPILPALDRRRAQLRAEAHALGAEVYREPPEDFAARLHADWRAWRSRVETGRSG